jgi:hypothetical protein
MVTCFELKRSVLLVSIAFLAIPGSFQIGMDAMDYLFGLNDKARTKDHPFSRLDPVHRCMAVTTMQSFEVCHSETLDNCCCKRTQLTENTCPICRGSSAHKCGAYPQESDLPSPSNHRSAGDMLSCGSDASPTKHAAAPRSER